MLANDELIKRFLRPKVAGEPLDGSFIHEADAYSAAPEKLVHGREHAPDTDRGDGKGKTWYFFSPAHCYQSARGGGSTGRRQRTVAREGCWRSEGRKKDVKDADGLTVGYLRMLSYVVKKSSPAMPRSFTRPGWCMAEFGLKKEDGADQLVLCKVYKPPHAEASSSTAASSAGQEAPPPIERKPFSDHDPVPVYSRPDNDPICESEAAIVKKDDAAAPEGEARHGEKAATGFTVATKFGGSSVASAERMTKVADLILSFSEERPVVVLSAMGTTTNNLLLAGEKAVSCGIEHVSEIPELTVVKELHLRTIHELGLDRSIIEGILY